MTSEPPPLPSPGDALDADSAAARAQRILESADAGAWGELHEAIEAERKRLQRETEDAVVVDALRRGVSIDEALGAQPPLGVLALRDVEPQLPAPVLWRGMTEEGEEPPADAPPDPLLLHGGVAVFGGVGGIGKSAVTLSIGLAAAHAAAAGEAWGEACGMRVRGAPVLMCGYEDDAEVLRWLADRFAGPAQADRWQETEALRIVETSAPLFAPSDAGGRGRPQPTRTWNGVWTAVREMGAKLLIVDPLTAAYSGDTNADTAGVRALLEASRREARAAGCGVLFVCHSAKSERMASGERQASGQLDAADIDPAAIAGSAAFYDGARGVVYMERAPSERQIARATEAAKKAGRPEPPPLGYDARLVCLKSNYGRAGWWIPLGEADPQRWAGFTAQWAGGAWA